MLGAVGAGRVAVTVSPAPCDGRARARPPTAAALLTKERVADTTESVMRTLPKTMADCSSTVRKQTPHSSLTTLPRNRLDRDAGAVHRGSSRFWASSRPAGGGVLPVRPMSDIAPATGQERMWKTLCLDTGTPAPAGKRVETGGRRTRRADCCPAVSRRPEAGGGPGGRLRPRSGGGHGAEPKPLSVSTPADLARAFRRPRWARAAERRDGCRAGHSSAMARSSAVVLRCGNGSSGTGTSRARHSGPHPSAGDHSTSRSAGTCERTSSLCAS